MKVNPIDTNEILLLEGLMLILQNENSSDEAYNIIKNIKASSLLEYIS